MASALLILMNVPQTLHWYANKTLQDARMDIAEKFALHTMAAQL